MGMAVRSRSNTAHKNRLTIPSSGFLLLYALSKGENWISWGLKSALLIEKLVGLGSSSKPKNHLLAAFIMM